MKMKDECLPCLINQVIKVADITKATNREKLYKDVFAYLSQIDFSETNPEIAGETFALLKKHIGNDDPYKEIRSYYNNLLLNMSPDFEEKIQKANDPFLQALKYAVIGNIIDFNPVHNKSLEDILGFIKKVEQMDFTIDHTKQLRENLQQAKILLYLGDNCGEICLDKLFIKKIKEQFKDLSVYFAVRGEAVVNDSIEEDAYAVGMDEVATIISNKDGSLGTVLARTSDEFRNLFAQADVIIAKGQANYECLSEIKNKSITFLLMTKCAVIANDIGVPVQSLICMQKE